MKKIAILGSTGSIGTQTLEVVRENKDIEVLALAAGNNITLLEQQIREFHPRLVGVWADEKAEELKSRIRDTGTKVVSGMDGLLEIAQRAGSDIKVTPVYTGRETWAAAYGTAVYDPQGDIYQLFYLN